MTPALSLLLLLLSAGQLLAQGGKKHALIVAVSHYAPGTGWGATSASNDALLLTAALRQQGFGSQQLRVLADAQATKAGIVAALHTLTDQVSAGDMVVFHFSGHGQQVQDDNHDEADGFDEALVPYDAAKHFVAGQYEGQHHLRDDELGTLLQALRQKLGPHGELLVLLDACHSGTGTRGLGRARGTTEPLAPAGYAPTPASEPNASFGLADARSTALPLAPMVGYFGSRPHELNYETTDGQGNGCGSLSLAFAESLSGITTASSYEGLFDAIKVKMAASSPNQNPQVEGAVSNRLFRGTASPVPAHYKAVRWLTTQRLVMDGGLLQGLFEQTEVALYPPDTSPATGKLLAKGRVVASTPTTATVELAHPLASLPSAAWVFVTARSYGPLRISVRLALPDQPLKAQLLAALAERPFVQVVAAGPADLTFESNNAFTQGNNLQLTTAQDQVVYHQPVPASPADAVPGVLEAIAQAAQARYLRGLQATAADVRLTLALVPIGAAGPATIPGQLRFPAGQYCQLKVTNCGLKDAYFTVLDIQPDNVFHVLLPATHDQPTDCFVAAGQARLLPDTIRLSPPYGTEMFKLISATQPLDLRELVSSQGRTQSRGLATPFAQLLALSYLRAGARSVPPTLPPESVNTTALVFTITAP